MPKPQLEAPSSAPPMIVGEDTGYVGNETFKSVELSPEGHSSISGTKCQIAGLMNLAALIVAGQPLAKYRPPPDSSASAFCAENMSQILQDMALKGATDSATFRQLGVVLA